MQSSCFPALVLWLITASTCHASPQLQWQVLSNMLLGKAADEKETLFGIKRVQTSSKV
jgi:hypothetical protein